MWAFPIGVKAVENETANSLIREKILILITWFWNNLELLQIFERFNCCQSKLKNIFTMQFTYL